jgi:hypothetical protein
MYGGCQHSFTISEPPQFAPLLPLRAHGPDRKIDHEHTLTRYEVNTQSQAVCCESHT